MTPRTIAYTLCQVRTTMVVLIHFFSSADLLSRFASCYPTVSHTVLGAETADSAWKNSTGRWLTRSRRTRYSRMKFLLFGTRKSQSLVSLLFIDVATGRFLDRVRDHLSQVWIRMAWRNKTHLNVSGLSALRRLLWRWLQIQLAQTIDDISIYFVSYLCQYFWFDCPIIYSRLIYIFIYLFLHELNERNETAIIISNLSKLQSDIRTLAMPAILPRAAHLAWISHGWRVLQSNRG